jgi:hypothetical protein
MSVRTSNNEGEDTQKSIVKRWKQRLKCFAASQGTHAELQEATSSYETGMELIFP